MDNEAISHKSANDSFIYDDGHFKQGKRSLFSQEDLFRDDLPVIQPDPHPLGIIDFGSNISLAEMSAGKPGTNSNLVSPKLLTGPEGIFDSGPLPSAKGQAGSSPTPKQQTGPQRTTSAAGDTQKSGSLNIKELSNASESAKRLFINQYSSSREAPSLSNYDPLAHNQAEHQKNLLPGSHQGSLTSGKGVNFADILIKSGPSPSDKSGAKVPHLHVDTLQSKSQNHFVKYGSGNADSKNSGTLFPNFQTIDERLLSSDGLQEREFNISFQRDPDSLPGTARKTQERLQELSNHKSEDKNSGRPAMILKGKASGITSETLLRLEQRYKKGGRSDPQDQKTLSHYRKDSVGKKLKETLVNLKCKGSINQPFRKKTEFIYLKANKDSQKTSRSNSIQKSGMKGETTKQKNPPKIQKPSVLSTLSSMILKTRKGSFGQTSSREASVRSKDSSSNMSKAGQQDKSGSRILHLLQQNAGSQLASRSASQKSAKRKNLLEFQSRVQEFNALKNDSKQEQVMGQDAIVQLASKKMTSNSTKRLFEKIFSKDNLKQGSSIEQERLRQPTENSAPTTASEQQVKPSRHFQQSARTDSRKNLELDSLLNKMHQANAQRSEKYQDQRPDKSQASQESKGHSKEPSLFTTKRSLLLDNVHLTRSLEKSGSQVKRSRDGGMASAMLPEMSINEVQKLSLMSSRTNPDIGFGLLNLSDLHTNQGNLTRNQFLKSKEQPSSARTDTNWNKGRREEQEVFTEKQDLIIQRKVLFGNGKGKIETNKGGLLNEAAMVEPLPRSATEGGLGVQSTLQRYQATKFSQGNEAITRPSQSPLQIATRKPLELKEFQQGKGQKIVTTSLSTRGLHKREVTPPPSQAQKPISTRSKQLNDFLNSFEERAREAEHM